MLLQTNSYIVPKEKRTEHARLMRRFRQALAKLGCDLFEVYEQVGPNWNGADSSGRYVQIMRFRDRKHQLAVQNAERSDAVAQAIINEFCDLVNFPYQQQQGLFAVGFYNSVLPTGVVRPQAELEGHGDPGDDLTAPVFDLNASAEIEPLSDDEYPLTQPAHTDDRQNHGVAHLETGATVPDRDVFDFDEQEEPQTAEELARELELQPPAPMHTPAVAPSPVENPGIHRNSPGR